MVKTSVLQVPINKSLRNQAEAVAEDYGFSSLQEAVRVFLTQFTARRVGIGFDEKEVILSHKARKRYERILEDIRENKNFTQVSSAADLFKNLDAC